MAASDADCQRLINLSANVLIYDMPNSKNTYNLPILASDTKRILKDLDGKSFRDGDCKKLATDNNTIHLYDYFVQRGSELVSLHFRDVSLGWGEEPVITNADDSEINNSAKQEKSKKEFVDKDPTCSTIKLKKAVDDFASKPNYYFERCGTCTVEESTNIEIKFVKIYTNDLIKSNFNKYKNYWFQDINGPCTHYLFIESTIKPPQVKPQPSNQSKAPAGKH